MHKQRREKGRSVKTRRRTGGKGGRGNRIGRPPNRPRINPPESPVIIAPRPEANSSLEFCRVDSHPVSENLDEQPQPNNIITPSVSSAAQANLDTSKSVEASTSATMSVQRGRPSRRVRVPPPFDINNLAYDELAVDIEIMTPGGDFVKLPNTIISPRFPRLFIPARTAEVLGWHPYELSGDDIQTFVTPLGRIRTTRAVFLYFTVPQLQVPLKLCRIPILDDDDVSLGVPLILGKPFIDFFFGDQWPLAETPYDEPLVISASNQSTAIVSQYVPPVVPPPQAEGNPGLWPGGGYAGHVANMPVDNYNDNGIPDWDDGYFVNFGQWYG
ncbi:hypothetical protein B0T24DRAFT_77500 [Lasiosphaeria ovina]|uniref:Uncharacterized protein n=1 Tax=Lasiosphaeria ovina TaxID=92902 RepID=A0AAE0TYJ1_9PEZI|nr:hypothetical protein B0T24DRAFT_77500 [Lasiosphaeria ovina]